MRKISRTVSSEESLERLRAESALTALYVSDEECSTGKVHTKKNPLSHCIRQAQTVLLRAKENGEACTYVSKV